MTQGALASISAPEGWDYRPLWAVAPRVVEKGFPQAEPLSVFLGDGVVPRSQRADNHNELGADLSAYQHVLPGDLVFNKLRTWQGGLGVSAYEGIVSPAYFVCRPDAAVWPRYLHYLLLSVPYRAELTRLSKWMPPSQFDIPWEMLRSLPLLLPSRDEQRQIAHSLDAQVALLDRAVGLRRRQMQLLDERAVSAMGEALTGGTAASAPSGTPWLPLIPENWTMGPVYGYYEIRLGKMLNPERAGGAHPAPYLRNANVHWFDISTDDLAVMSFEPDERERYRLRSGDLLVCEGGAGIAEAAVWQGEVEECYYQKSLHRVRATSHLPVNWLLYWLRVAKSAGLFGAGGNLATIPHLTAEQLRAYRIPVPPRSENPLVGLEEQLAAMRLGSRHMSKSITLLQERKQALITAAVTGAVDVATARGVA